MAPSDAADGEPASAQGTVAAQRVLRVAGAGGVEAAVRAEQRAHEPPVQLDEADQERAHRWRTLSQSASTLARSAALLADPAPGLAFTTRSTDGNSCWLARKVSRTMRFTRLRLTALPAARTPTAKPSLACPRPFGRAITENKASETRCPSRWTRSNSGLSVRRWSRGNRPRGTRGAGGEVPAVRPRDACGPWHDDGSARAGRSSWPCAHGSRGSSCDGGCSVDRCASWCGSVPAVTILTRNKHLHWSRKEPARIRSRRVSVNGPTHR